MFNLHVGSWVFGVSFFGLHLGFFPCQKGDLKFLPQLPAHYNCPAEDTLSCIQASLGLLSDIKLPLKLKHITFYAMERTQLRF